MKTWQKNLIAAAVLLVVCAGIYMNWMYTNAQKVMSENGIILDLNEPVSGQLENSNVTDYFAAVRLSRQEARDSAVSLLQEAMSYGDSNGADPQAQLEMIVQTALCEAQIESLIIAKGYTDCVAYMTETGISVAVAAPEGGMQQTDVAVIADIVITQTGFTYEQIRVVEVP